MIEAYAFIKVPVLCTALLYMLGGEIAFFRRIVHDLLGKVDGTDHAVSLDILDDRLYRRSCELSTAQTILNRSLPRCSGNKTT